MEITLFKSNVTISSQRIAYEHLKSDEACTDNI